MKKSIINFIIILTIIFQFGYFRNETTNENLLDFSSKDESIDVALYHYDMLIDILLKNVDSSKKYNFFLVTNKETSVYNYGLGYLYLRWKLYPNYIPPISDYNTVNEKSEYLKDIGTNYDLDYVFVVGKDTNFFGTVTISDLTLFHLDDKKNNVYSVVDQINFSLYDLYKLDRVKYDKMSAEVEYRIEKFWDFYSIDLMRYLVVDAYNDGNYKLAKKYGLYYTDKVDYINELVNPILAEISYKEGNKKEALKYFKICLKNYLCDLEDNETYKELLDKDER